MGRREGDAGDGESQMAVVTTTAIGMDEDGVGVKLCLGPVDRANVWSASRLPIGQDGGGEGRNDRCNGRHGNDGFVVRDKGKVSR